MAVMRFEQAIDAYHNEIYRYLYRLCLVSGEAEPMDTAADLTQDTFERAFKAYGRLQPDSNVRAWLYTIAANRARDYYRHRQHHQNYLQTSTSPTSSTAEQMAQVNQQRQRLTAGLARLPAKQREAVRLRYLAELEYQEIGQILGCSTASARANVYQGLKKLRKQLKAHQEVSDDE